MAKKFVTTSELALIHSWVGELMETVSKQDVLYYAIDLKSSRVHDIYEEAVQKSFAPPVLISARVEFTQGPTKTGMGTEDAGYELNVELHVAECIRRNVRPREGDFIEHGQVFFEITTVGWAEAVFGQINDRMAYKLTCVPSREAQFMADSSTADGVDNSHPVQPAPPRSLGDDLAPPPPGPTYEQLTNVQGNDASPGEPVYLASPGNFSAAAANSEVHATVVGLTAIAIPATTMGQVVTSGPMTLTTDQWDAVAGTDGGLTPAAFYYLPPFGFGELTETPPSFSGKYLTNVGYALSSTTLMVAIQAPVLIP